MSQKYTVTPIDTSKRQKSQLSEFVEDDLHTSFEKINLGPLSPLTPLSDELEPLSPLTPLSDELDSLPNDECPILEFWHRHADDGFLLDGETPDDLKGPAYIYKGACASTILLFSSLFTSMECSE